MISKPKRVTLRRIRRPTKLAPGLVSYRSRKDEWIGPVGSPERIKFERFAAGHRHYVRVIRRKQCHSW